MWIWPPTPANYAQRSGRAALVFTYCTSGSPHDQYFFKRPERMFAGAVTPPRLDLANEDLECVCGCGDVRGAATLVSRPGFLTTP